MYLTNNSWASVSTITFPSGIYNIASLDCPSATQCTAIALSGASSPSVIITINSGSTWSSSTNANNLSWNSQLSCPTISICVATWSTSYNIRPVSLDYSSNSGASWSVSQLPNPAAGVTTAACPSKTDCIALGYDLVSSAYSYAYNPVALVSRDSGNTWTQVALPNSASYSELTCASSGFCMAAGGESFSVPATLITTSDGGNTWITVNLPTGTTSISDVYCYSSAMCILEYATSTSQANGAISTDGGITWTTDQGLSGIEPAGIYCSSPTICMAMVGQTGMIVTTTGGKYWSVVNLPSEITKIISFECLNPNYCILISYAPQSNNLISAISDNFGQSWQINQLNATFSLGNPALICNPDLTCLMYNQSTYYYSNDGGVSFQPGMLPSANPLSEVFMSCGTSEFLFMQVTSYGFQVFASSPVITSLSASSGPMTGGSRVDIFGNGLEDATGVEFGTVQALSFSVVSASEITAVSPANTSSGNVNVSVESAEGSSNSLPFLYTAGGSYTPVTPVRIADTRVGATDPPSYAGDTLTPRNEVLNVNVVGANSDGVPSNAIAVVVNITAVNASSDSYLTVFPGFTAEPDTSSLNFKAGQGPVANLVEVPIGALDYISIENFMGSVDVIVDIEGYVAPPNGTSGLFNPVTPFRVADTRTGASDPSTYAGKTLQSGTSLNVGVTGISSGSSSIPATNVSAVVLNITVTNPTGSGYVSVYPTNSTPNPQALTSIVNFSAGQSVPNRDIVAVGQGGDITVNVVGASADVIVDISGWFTGSATPATGALYYPVTPTRIVDTRTGSTFQGEGTTLQPGLNGALGTPDTENTTNIADDGVPSNAIAILSNVTVTNTSTNGYLTLFPQGQSPPNSSDLNWSSGETTANCTIIGLGSTGEFSMASGSSATDAIVDVSGYYA